MNGTVRSKIGGHWIGLGLASISVLLIASSS